MPDSTTSPKSQLYEHLKRTILVLDLPPGTDLDETRLSDEFSLSRTPLRDVFRQLAGEGYLELRENRGARVANMSFQTLRDFFLVAPMIYSAVMRLAAQNAKPDQIAQLRTAQETFKAALASGDASERALANNAFHLITGEMADNRYLLPSFHRLLIDHCRIGRTFYGPNDRSATEAQDTASAQHDAIIEAIAQGDAADAARLADAHWALSRDRIEQFAMPAGLSAPLGEILQVETT